MESSLVAIITVVLGLAGAWAVVQYKTESHTEAIRELVNAKAVLDTRIASMSTEIAVLRSRSEDGDRRLTESLATIEKTIAQFEQRMIAHVDSLVQAFSRSAK